MRRILFVLIFIVQLYSAIGQQNRDNNFNLDWKFHKGDQEGAQKYAIDDSEWRKLDLPHDWSIEDLPITKKRPTDKIISGPFDLESIGGKYSGFTIGGIGWYRKHFKLQKADSDKIVYLNFDGIYMNSTIWINGKQVNSQPYGYSAFWIDISAFLNFGKKENIIAVQVKNDKLASRWYAGSGIYRNVTLRIVDRVHIKPWGIYVSSPKVNKETANVCVSAQIINTTTENKM